MKKPIRILLSVLVLLSLAFTAFACEETGDNPGGGDKPAAETFEITVVNGEIADKGYNHDVVEKDTKVTVVANEAASAEEAFSHWEIDGEQVSADATYEVTVSADTTITAVYGSNYSVWDGEYPEQAPDTYVEDEENKVIHIGSAEALAYWGAMVTNSKDGTARTAWKYSTFNWGNYTRLTSGQELTDELVADAVKQSYIPDNQWTLSIECNIDLAGYEWTPVNDNCFDLNDLIIDGNNHVIKGLYTRHFAMGEAFITGGHSSGFFGEVTGTNLYFKDLTFDGATTTNLNERAGQDLAIVLGYAHGGMRQNYFKHDYPDKIYQVTSFDNVNIVNSKVVGANASKKAGLILGRVGTSNEAPHELQHVIVKNCTLSNNLIVASSVVGVIGGHLYSADDDVTVRNQHVFDVYNVVITDFNAITTFNGSAEAPGGSSYQVGTLGCWDKFVWAADDPSGQNTWYQHPENFDLNNGEINLIDLHTNNQMATSIKTFNDALIAANEEGVLTNSEIFLAQDVNYDDPMALPDWSANDDQVVYLVFGAEVTGLDLGDNVRCIPGERNANGDLIVTDVEGNVIGAWVITDYVGAFVAAE